MQENDLDAVNNQRRRRKRIGRIKNAIILIISGWILLSMILIICLFVKLNSLENKLDHMIVSTSAVSTEQVNMNQSVAVEESTEQLLAETTEEIEDYEPVVPLASGIAEADNVATAGDVHKVYLTFDDGPSENTEEILDILAEYDVKATFFVIGKEDEVSQELYRRIVEEGHTLGMHSYSNKYSVIYQSQEAFSEDFNKLQDYLYEVTGVECEYYRFPGGSSNQISNVPMNNFIHYLNQNGIIYYDWNVSAGDATVNAYSSDEIVANVTTDVVKYKTSIVSLHDITNGSATVEALEPLIEALQEMEAEILPIDKDTTVIQYIKADSVE